MADLKSFPNDLSFRGSFISYFLHTRWGYLLFYPGTENLILSMLSHPGCHEKACIGCMWTHAICSSSDIICMVKWRYHIISYLIFSFILLRRNINYLLPRLLNRAVRVRRIRISIRIVVFFWPWSSKVVTYANFISDHSSLVFAKYTGIN